MAGSDCRKAIALPPMAWQDCASHLESELALFIYNKIVMHICDKRKSPYPKGTRCVGCSILIFYEKKAVHGILNAIYWPQRQGRARWQRTIFLKERPQNKTITHNHEKDIHDLGHCRSPWRCGKCLNARGSRAHQVTGVPRKHNGYFQPRKRRFRGHVHFEQRRAP